MKSGYHGGHCYTMLKATSKKTVLFKEIHVIGPGGGKYKKEERKKSKKGNKKRDVVIQAYCFCQRSQQLPVAQWKRQVVRTGEWRPSTQGYCSQANVRVVCCWESVVAHGVNDTGLLAPEM